MFNNDEFGDYLIFSAWPQYRVFTDGRSDMYGEKHGSPYLKVAGVQPGWKDILQRYAVSWIFFPTQTALSAALLEQPDWHADLFRQSSHHLRAEGRRTSTLNRQIPISAGSTSERQ